MLRAGRAWSSSLIVGSRSSRPLLTATVSPRELLAAGGPARVPAPGGGDEDAPHAAGPESISCGCVASTRRCRCRTRSASPKGSRTRARSGASVLCGVAVDQLSAAQGDRGDRVDPEPMQPGRSVRTARVGLLHRPRHRVHSYRPLASGSLAGEGSPLGELADGHGCRRQAARRGGCSKRSSTNRRRSRGPQTSRVQVARRDRLGSVAASARSFTVQSWRR